MRRPDPDPSHAFLQRLTPAQRDALASLKAQARQALPHGWVPWRSAARHLGHLPAARAQRLCEQLDFCQWSDGGLLWDVDALAPDARSALLQAWLVTCRDGGTLTGWRNERFSYWHTDYEDADAHQPPFLSVERAGFRFLGMLSHAVHINGFLDDGRVWCGRRAPDKATDPGLLDNLAAGGLPTGEPVLGCAVRELWEEAGLTVLPAQLHAAGRIRISRATPTGWHDELLHVLNLRLPPHSVPNNQDGEVAGFRCLQPADLLAQVQHGAFTVDAALALVQGLGL